MAEWEKRNYVANNQEGSLGWVILGLTALTAVLFAIAYKRAKGVRVKERKY